MATGQINVVVNTPVPPRLPAAPVEYNARFQEDHSNILRLYFNRLKAFLDALFSDTGGALLKTPFGAFQDNTTQTQSATNTAKAVTFGTTDGANGIALGTPTSRVIVANGGWYNFQFSAQLDKASGSAASVWLWPKVNGVSIPDSASKVSIQGTTAESVPAWNWVLPMNANDYFELFWLTDDVNVQLKHEAGFGTAPNDVPEIPSVILTVTFVSALTT